MFYRFNFNFKMKKLILLVAVVTAISFASCSNKAKEAAAPEAEAPEFVQEEATLEDEAAVEAIDAIEVEVEEAPAE